MDNASPFFARALGTGANTRRRSGLFSVISKLATTVRSRFHPLWRLRQMRSYRWVQRKLDFTVYPRIPGAGIRVAVKLMRDGSFIAFPKIIDPEVQAAFQLVLELLNPTVFWDVGANIGFYSWLVRRHPSIREVVMFEPDPTNFALINRTIRKNGIRDCRPVQVALTEACGSREFLVDNVSGTTGSVKSSSPGRSKNYLHHSYQLQESITCATATIDSLLADGFAPPGLVKIDVEGAEHLVLAGAEGCLAKHLPTLIVETYKEPLVGRLRELGYRAFQIDAGDILFIPARLGIDFARVEAAFRERQPAE